MESLTNIYRIFYIFSLFSMFLAGLSRNKRTNSFPGRKWEVLGTRLSRVSVATCRQIARADEYCARFFFWTGHFPSSLVPLFQNESKCKTFHMNMSSACSFIFMQIKVIFIRMVSHLDSFWNRGTRELGNGLLRKQIERCHELILKTTVSRYIAKCSGKLLFVM